VRRGGGEEGGDRRGIGKGFMVEDVLNVIRGSYEGLIKGGIKRMMEEG
jgi:hypothetical protein